MTGRLKLVAVNLAVLGVMLALGLGCAEVAVRLLSPQKAHWLDVFAPHAVLPFSTKPNVDRTIPGSGGNASWLVRTDDEGFRVVADKDDTRPVALWLGDSFVYGLGIEAKDLFHAQLARRDGAVHAPFAGGIPGYSPIEYRKALEHFLVTKRPARAFVVLYLGNDFIECQPGRPTTVSDGILGNSDGLIERVLQMFHVARLIERTIRAHATWGTPGLFKKLRQPSAWKDGPLAIGRACVRDELKTMSELARRAQIPLDAVLIPDIRMILAEREKTAPTEDDAPLTPHTFIVEDLTALQIPFIDLLPALAAHDVATTFLANDVHLNARGNTVAADAILEARPELLQRAP